MAGILELSDQESKATMSTMLRALMEKVDNIKEQTGNVSQEIGIQRKNQREMLEIKIVVLEIKNAFDRLLSRLHS